MPSGTVASATSTVIGGTADDAIDGDVCDGWQAGGYTGTLTLTFPSATSLSAIQFVSGASPATPEAYTIQGEIGSTWMQIGQATEDVPGTQGTLPLISLTPGLYDALQISVDGMNSWVFLYEVSLYPGPDGGASSSSSGSTSGSSSGSSSSSGSTGSSGAADRPIPQIVSVQIADVDAGDWTASVSWLPVTDGGPDFDGYVITATPKYDAGLPAASILISGAATSGDLSGLTFNADYEFTVAADSSNGGAGPPSPPFLLDACLEEEPLSFSVSPISSPVTSAYIVAVGDLNGDGFADFALTSYSSQVTIFIGDGHGSFASGVNCPVPGPSIWDAVGVFGANRTPGLITSAGNGVTLSLDFDGGGFASTNTYPAVTNATATLGDFNGDGLLDVVAASSTGAPIVMLLGLPDAGLDTANEVAIAGGNANGTILVGDFNEDGSLDLVTSSSGTFRLFLGYGDGGLMGERDATDGNGDASDVGDFNGDGHLDLAFSQGNDSVSVFFGVGDGTFLPASTVTLSESVRQVIAADVNQDGLSDLVLSTLDFTGTSGSVVVCYGEADGGFIVNGPVLADGEGFFIQVGDFNGDTLLEVITSSEQTGTLKELINTTPCSP